MEDEAEIMIRDLTQILNLSRRIRGNQDGSDTSALTLLASKTKECLRRMRSWQDTTYFAVDEFQKGLKGKD